MDATDGLIEQLLQEAKENCITRAESLLQAELAQVRAQHSARLNPCETLVTLEAFKLGLMQAKDAFASGETERGLETVSTVHSKLNRLVSNLLHGR